MKKYITTEQVGSLQPGTHVIQDKKKWHLVHADGEGKDVLVEIEDEALIEALDGTKDLAKQ